MHSAMGSRVQNQGSNCIEDRAESLPRGSLRSVRRKTIPGVVFDWVNSNYAVKTMSEASAAVVLDGVRGKAAVLEHCRRAHRKPHRG